MTSCTQAESPDAQKMILNLNENYLKAAELHHHHGTLCSCISGREINSASRTFTRIWGQNLRLPRPSQCICEETSSLLQGTVSLLWCHSAWLTHLELSELLVNSLKHDEQKLKQPYLSSPKVMSNKRTGNSSMAGALWLSSLLTDHRLLRKPKNDLEHNLSKQFCQRHAVTLSNLVTWPHMDTHPRAQVTRMSAWLK